MNKYVVKMLHVFSTIVEVEAENKESAIDVAEKKFTKDNNDNESSQIYYEATMEKNNWAVLSLEEFNELKSKIKETLENNTDEQSNKIITPNNF